MRLRTTLAAAIVLAAATTLCAAPSRAADASCPNNGTVRWGIEPFENAAKMQPVYENAAKALAKELGCNVQVYIGTSYNAEIEAMRAGKLEIGEFGPLGYILAHQIANARVFATYMGANGGPSTYTASIVVPKTSTIKTVKDVAGHSFAYSDPESTSGHLMPAYALKKNGIDPDTGVKAVYAGSHIAAYEALRNGKVDAGELNSNTVATVSRDGNFKADDWVTLWKSDPIPNDPIAVRADLPDAFKAKLRTAFTKIDLTTIDDPGNVLKGLGHKFVVADDKMYDPVRDLVSTLKIDLTKL